MGGRQSSQAWIMSRMTPAQLGTSVPARPIQTVWLLDKFGRQFSVCCHLMPLSPPTSATTVQLATPTQALKMAVNTCRLACMDLVDMGFQPLLVPRSVTLPFLWLALQATELSESHHGRFPQLSVRRREA